MTNMSTTCLSRFGFSEQTFVGVALFTDSLNDGVLLLAVLFERLQLALRRRKVALNLFHSAINGIPINEQAKD